MHAVTARPRRSRLAIAAAVTLAGLAAAVAPARAGVTYSYNDWVNLEYPAYNTADDSPNPVASDIWLGNLFDADPRGQWITRLSANFDSTMPVGTPVSVLVYDDPNDDGDLSDIVLLRRVDSTVQNTSAGYYSGATGFDIPATYVSGKFIAAVLVPNQPASATFRVDATAPHNRSYFAANVVPAHVGTFDPAHPNSADQPVQWIGPYDVFVRASGRATQYARAQDAVTIDSFSDGAVSLSHDGTQQDGLASVVGGNRIISAWDSAAVDTTTGRLTLSGGPISVAYGAQYNGNFGFQSGPGTALNANLSGFDALRINIASQSPGSRLEIHLSLMTDGQTSSLATYFPTIYTGYGQTGAFDIPLAPALGSVDYYDLDHITFTFYNYGGTVSIDSIQFVTLPIPGDVNGDDKLDADDYILLDRGFHQRLTGRVNGDLNGDGAIDAADYLQLDTAFALAGNALSPQLLHDRAAAFGDAYVAQLLASVPEPSSLLAACGLAVPLVTRRRRSQ